MSLGIVLLIKADLGSAPWDVLHVGLYMKVGLTIGTWSIIVGIIILGSAALLERRLPQVGALLNMLLVGVFIDLYLLLPFIQTPSTLLGKIIMLISGIFIIGYGMGIYIAADCGAGPRDSLMLVLSNMTGWSVAKIRLAMEVVVLFFGWLLGGPVFLGTIIFCISIGAVVGFALPQCRQVLSKWMYEGVKVEHSFSQQ
ncbi:YczE/YyaS/YitT family protein [Bacillus solimangrovi]|nr:YitT family protein [Bacillus solimangrovi]